MSGLLTDLLAEGYAGALVVGTDTPTLPTAYLVEAGGGAPAGGAADVVLGPSEDGGYYLIGLTAPAPDLFVDMAWSTATVCEETLRRARAAGRRVSVLPRGSTSIASRTWRGCATIRGATPIGPGGRSPAWRAWRSDGAAARRAETAGYCASGEAVADSAVEGSGSSSTQFQGTVMMVRGVSSSMET